MGGTRCTARTRRQHRLPNEKGIRWSRFGAGFAIGIGWWTDERTVGEPLRDSGERLVVDRGYDMQ